MFVDFTLLNNALSDSGFKQMGRRKGWQVLPWNEATPWNRTSPDKKPKIVYLDEPTAGLDLERVYTVRCSPLIFKFFKFCYSAFF